MTINPLVRIAILLALSVMTPAITVAAQDQVVSDFTMGATIPKSAKHDWNLGPTGLRGWIFYDKLVTTDARQIINGSSAADMFQVGDVILGVGGKLEG